MVDRIDQPVDVHVDEKPADGGKIHPFYLTDIPAEDDAGIVVASQGPTDAAIGGFRVF